MTRFVWGIAVFMAVLATVTSVDACSNLSVVMADGAIVIARTMELEGLTHNHEQFPFTLETFKRNTEFSGASSCEGTTLPSNSLGFAAITNHIPFMNPVSSEGMNESGFTISLQLFTIATYQTSSGNAGKTPICYMDVVMWALGQFSTVAQLVAALTNDVYVVKGKRPSSGNYGHWIAQDATGANVVIEYINGQLAVHDNSQVGVVTNQPSYEWHVTNLDNYIALASSADAKLLKNMQAIVPDLGTFPSNQGHGFNTIGLPGDSSPASRFVRLFYLKGLALANGGVPKTLTSAIQMASALINTVFIPTGSATPPSVLGGYDSTQWTVIKIPSTKEFLFRTYANNQWRRIQLADLDFTQSQTYALYNTGDGILDVSPLPKQQSPTLTNSTAEDDSSPSTLEITSSHTHRGPPVIPGNGAFRSL